MNMNFKARRLSATPKITLQEIADLAGVTPATVLNVESGRSPNPGILTVAAIDTALKHLENERANSVSPAR